MIQGYTGAACAVGPVGIEKGLPKTPSRISESAIPSISLRYIVSARFNRKNSTNRTAKVNATIARKIQDVEIDFDWLRFGIRNTAGFATEGAIPQLRVRRRRSSRPAMPARNRAAVAGSGAAAALVVTPTVR